MGRDLAEQNKTPVELGCDRVKDCGTTKFLYTDIIHLMLCSKAALMHKQIADNSKSGSGLPVKSMLAVQ